jgi:hypothetical protein
VKKSTAGVLGLALALTLGAVLVAGSVLAKSNCRKDCRHQLITDFKTCKASCPKGKAGKDCRKACVDEHKSDLADCKAAVNPMPPTCGDVGSPSGAFLDPSTL